MRTKLLFVIDGLEFGGGERLFLQLAAGLRDHFEISVASMSGGRFEQQVKELGIRFYPINMSEQLSLKPIRQIKEIIQNNEIGLLHSQGTRADFFARIAVRILKSKPRVVSTIQMPVEGFDASPLRKNVYRFFDRFSERYVDRFIVVSEVLRKTLINQHKIPEGKVVKIYNGIELLEYEPDDSGELLKKIKKEYSIPEDVFLIGAVGRMVWQKGFEYLIESIPEIIETLPRSKILIVGDGPLLEKLKALGERLELGKNIIFTGFRSDIKEMLSTIDILVIPSLLEGFPMITLEAMAMAKPIVATRIDGITEQITDGVNGILVPPKDPSILAKTVVRVLNDKKLARSMGLAAREKVEQEFSVEKMVTETEKVYLSFLKTG